VKVVAYNGMNLSPQQTIRMKKMYDREAMDVMSSGGEMEPFEAWVKAYLDAENDNLEKGFTKATGIKKMKPED